MYNVVLIKDINDKQTEELIVKTPNKHYACLAFEGALVGLRFDLKDKNAQEKRLYNEVQYTYDNNIIKLIMKEENQYGRKRNEYNKRNRNSKDRYKKRW